MFGRDFLKKILVRGVFYENLRVFFFVLLLFLAVNLVFADEDKSQQVPKVARISFIEGDAKIRRGEDRVWEKAVMNLPLVEGDSIATDDNSKLEIQLDKNSYIRLDGNSYLKISTLRSEGTVISLLQGNLSLRLFNFDKRESFFEIDAPKTTIAIQKEGLYRIDASDDAEVKIKTVEGEARIYSADSGFTLRTGRSAIIQVKGENAGDWNFSMILSDEWDEWVEKRDRKVVEKLNRANYGRFYEDTFYGAEDLEEYGSWIYTREYGWVWKPYDSALRIYPGWSPYRYGHWRWIPPFGWVWICDEPWGWVTYHYGRWVYINGWVWIPHHPSWGVAVWSPALVVIAYVRGYICWYPLPYYYSYHYTKVKNYYNTTIIVNNPTPQPLPSPAPQPSPSPTPVPSPLPTPAPPSDDTPPTRRKPLSPRFPFDAVVAVKEEECGLIRASSQKITADIVDKVLQAEPNLMAKLPKADLTKSDWLAQEPKKPILSDTSTGIIPREPGVSMDEKIRRTKVFDGRIPVEESPQISKPIDGREEKDVGAIKRNAPVQIIKRDDSEKWEDKSERPVKERPAEKSERKPREKVDEERTPPIYVPPVEVPKQSEEPRRPMPRPRQETPPPAKEEPQRPMPRPRQETPPPTREEPRPAPKPKEETPPPQEQKPSEKPFEGAQLKRHNKDD